jgi:hypothetical protein
LDRTLLGHQDQMLRRCGPAEPLLVFADGHVITLGGEALGAQGRGRGLGRPVGQSPGVGRRPAIASVQYPYQLALHNAPLAASPAASTTEMAGLANIVTPGTKLNTVCSPSKPTRAAGHELQNPCRTSSGLVAFGWLLAMCCWSSLITSAGITVVDCAIIVLRFYD